MSATDTAEAAGSPRKSKLPLLLGLVLAVVLGGAGFYAAWSGLLPFGRQSDETRGQAPRSEAAAAEAVQGEAVQGEAPVFVPVDPMVVMLGQAAGSRHLRFRAELEVAPGSADAVTAMMPRVLDVLNGYLRAVPVAEIESPSALVRLRAQMLRRVQLVTGKGAVRDLLVTEFVLN
jgi:flagellar FliL protein